MHIAVEFKIHPKTKSAGGGDRKGEKRMAQCCLQAFTVHKKALPSLCL